MSIIYTLDCFKLYEIQGSFVIGLHNKMQL